MEKILVIDDDAVIRKIFKMTLAEAGYHVLEAADGKEGLMVIHEEKPSLVLTDYKMPGADGLEVLGEVIKKDLDIPVIMLTGHGDVSLTIQSIQEGAYEFLEKPTTPELLLSTVKRALESARISRELPEILCSDEEIERELDRNFLVGKSPHMREIFKSIGMISQTKVNVLLEGETGTGKELITRLIHLSGVTRDKPLVVVNFSALTETLLESELFGHVKGAFTDSVRDKPGKFELAGEGTIFLDEISEASLNTQLKLLRVIQELEFERVGGETTIPMKARIIAATNRNLEEAIREGKFRADLYYRLKVVTIELPPLRKRKIDIKELVVHFLYKLNKRFGKNVTKIGDGVIDMLMEHSWPGNVRELENVILQGIIMAKSDVLEKKNLKISHSLSLEELGGMEELTPLMSIADVEKVHIQRVLDHVMWSKVEASRILGISRPTLNAKIERYQLSPP